jgi:hypothetical protein
MEKENRIRKLLPFHVNFRRLICMPCGTDMESFWGAGRDGHIVSAFFIVDVDWFEFAIAVIAVTVSANQTTGRQRRAGLFHMSARRSISRHLQNEYVGLVIRSVSGSEQVVVEISFISSSKVITRVNCHRATWRARDHPYLARQLLDSGI